MALLELRSVVKTYGSSRRRSEAPRPVVDDVSFDLERGQTLSLVGESGAGKSTTGLLALRLIEADSGTITLDGTDVRDLDPNGLRAIRRRMQMIFQDPQSSFDPRVSIGRSVSEPLLVHFGTNKADREKRTTELLHRVGLGAHVADRLPHELSGGMLQRAAIARALSLEPDLIVCDEAVSALDVSIRAQVLNLLADIQEESGVTYLFISHDLGVVEAISDVVAVMRNGRIVELGTTEAVYSHPTDPYTNELLAAVPVADPRRRAGRAEAVGAAEGIA